MKKNYLTLLIVAIIGLFCADGLVAKTTTGKNQKKNTPNHSLHSSKPDVSKKIVKNEIEFENGLTIINYSLDVPLPQNYRWVDRDDDGFHFSIDWPINGPQPLLDNCQRFIQEIIGIDIINDSDITIPNFIEKNYKEYNADFLAGKKDEDGLVQKSKNIDISANTKKLLFPLPGLKDGMVIV